MKKLIKIMRFMNLSFKKYLWKYILCMFCIVGYTIMNLIYPGLISLIIDKGVAEKNLHDIVKYSIIFLIIGFLMILLYYLQRVSFTKLSKNFAMELQNNLIKKVLTVNYKFWISNSPGDVITVIQQDVSKIESFFISVISNAIVNIFMAISVGIYLVKKNLIIGTILIGLTFIFVTIQRYFGVKSKEGNKKIRRQQGALFSYINDIINHLPNIQMLGMSNKVKRQSQFEMEGYVQEYIAQIKLLSVIQNISMLFSNLGVFCVFLIGAVGVFYEKMTVGILFSLTMYVQKLYDPVINLANTYISIKNIEPILDKVLGIFETKDVIPQGNLKKDKINGKINIKNLYFRYDNAKKDIFSDFNINIEPGKIIGLVGENGVGKSTMLRLFTKLSEPIKGNIYLDDIDILKYDTQWLWSQMGIMTQETYLPKGKIKDILGIDKRQYEMTEELLKEIHFDCKRLYHGWDTEIGENSITLSGGESQKLAFVRLILQNKSLYILDEPTSALDLESEDLILHLIKKYISGKTCIIITHRPKLLEICDRIIKI